MYRNPEPPIEPPDPVCPVCGYIIDDDTWVESEMKCIFCVFEDLDGDVKDMLRTFSNYRLNQLFEVLKRFTILRTHKLV